MIYIKKSREPNSLLQYRLQENASYDGMDRAVKDELLEQLLREQGYLCAYCMKRIKKEIPTSGIPAVSIEHWSPRNSCGNSGDNHELDYKNMLAVCSGNRGCGCFENLTCDARKGNDIITVNPCNENTLRSISYTSDGKIKSSVPAIDEDLNEKLNLNEPLLLANRKEILMDRKKRISSKCNSNADFSRICKKELEHLLEMNDQKLPYVGILIWWLKKHIK